MPYAISHQRCAPVVGVLLALALTSCAYVPAPSPSPSEPHLVALDATQCRDALRDDSSPESLERALARSVDALQKLPADRTLNVLDRRVSVADLLAMLNSLSGATSVAAQICDRFRVYRVALSEPLLVTGYYQPELTASRERSERFRYPMYRTPGDIVDIDLGQFCTQCNGRIAQGRVQNGSLIPYYSRAEVDGGALDGRSLELAWLDDPVEAYFLHVQGSAVLRFADGVRMQISYGGSNGRPYTSIGRVLIEQGKMARDAVSMQALKNYLRAHPDEQAALMNANQRYIFFRTVVAGPIGSLGAPLTAGRSIAADASVYPTGGLTFLHVAARAAGFAERDQPNIGFQRFALIQDAGSAITGANRLDVFWGTGSTAEAIAGELRDAGELYLVLPQ